MQAQFLLKYIIPKKPLSLRAARVLSDFLLRKATYPATPGSVGRLTRPRAPGSTSPRKFDPQTGYYATGRQKPAGLVASCREDQNLNPVVQGTPRLTLGSAFTAPQKRTSLQLGARPAPPVHSNPPPERYF